MKLRVGHPRLFIVHILMAALVAAGEVQTSAAAVKGATARSHARVNVSSVGLLANDKDVINMCISGNCLYAVIDEDLWILDISNGDNPRLLCTYNGPKTDIKGVDVQGNYAFVTCEYYMKSNFNGLMILDVSNPAHPTPVADCGFRQGGADISVGGGIGAIALPHKGIAFFGIGNGSNPRITGAADTPGYIRDIRIIGNLVVAADEAVGLIVFDLSNPNEPKVVWNSPSHGADGLSSDCRYLYAASGGLEIRDMQAPQGSFFDLKARADWEYESACAVAVENKIAFLKSQYGDGLRIYDVNRADVPRMVGAVKSNSSYLCYDLLVHNGFIYVGCERGLAIWRYDIIPER